MQGAGPTCSTSPGFKKLKGVCHEEVAAETLDAETASKAVEVQSGAAKLEGGQRLLPVSTLIEDTG